MLCARKPYQVKNVIRCDLVILADRRALREPTRHPVRRAAFHLRCAGGSTQWNPCSNLGMVTNVPELLAGCASRVVLVSF